MVLGGVTWFLMIVPLFGVMVFAATADTRRSSIIAFSWCERSEAPRSIQQHTTQVILYHKPANVVTTHANEDVLGRLNVYQDLVQRSRQNGEQENYNNHDGLPSNFPMGWHAVGRLDAATSGLLLLTNDGGLVHHVTNHLAVLTDNATTICSTVEKTYEALVMGHHPIESPLFSQFRQGGIELKEKHFTLPVQNVHVLCHPTASSTLVSLSLIEGRHRQIRLMFHACGSGVMRLKRTAIGLTLPSKHHSHAVAHHLTIDMVPNEGDWCVLSDHQISTSLGWKTRTWDENKSSIRANSRRNWKSKAASPSPPRPKRSHRRS
jgi:pseudouridine synthase